MITGTLAAVFRSEIESEEAIKVLSTLPVEELAEFIVDAFNRGWISNFNIGLNDEGHPV